MATKGSTYAQDMPEGVKKHRAHVREMAEAAKSQRAKKGRGNGKRYAYDGVKKAVVTALLLLGLASVAEAACWQECYTLGDRQYCVVRCSGQ